MSSYDTQLPAPAELGDGAKELAMRIHLNSVVSCAYLLAAATALNASEVRVWGDTTLASPSEIGRASCRERVLVAV